MAEMDERQPSMDIGDRWVSRFIGYFDFLTPPIERKRYIMGSSWSTVIILVVAAAAMGVIGYGIYTLMKTLPGGGDPVGDAKKVGQDAKDVVKSGATDFGRGIQAATDHLTDWVQDTLGIKHTPEKGIDWNKIPEYYGPYSFQHNPLYDENHQKKTPSVERDDHKVVAHTLQHGESELGKTIVNTILQKST